ncbi:MAG TPA: hypothetical protein VHX44_08050 [Planctomycetota bacterium]|nr:hypothetical protein [Planctomycetota bacterium]
MATRAPGLDFVPVFGGEVDVVAVRGVLVRDRPLVFGFALLGLRPGFCGVFFMMMATPRTD